MFTNVNGAMFSTLPAEINEYVSLVSVNPLFDEFVPRRMGCTDNAFFVPNEKTNRVPTVETRVVRVPMPEELRIVYERYPDDTEFTAFGWIMLSEREIVKRRTALLDAGQSRLVDIGITYEGLGHVSVVSYDPESECVLESLDGGANGWDRQHNHAARTRLDVENVTKTSFDAWWRAQKGKVGGSL